MIDRRNRWLWLGGLAMAAGVFGQALWEWDRGGFGDWGWFHHSWEVARVAIFRHGEFPLWDPYHCGGVTSWGQPQSQHLAPTYWLTGLLFDTTHGHKIFVIAHHAIGFVGLYVYLRRGFRLHTPAAFGAALLWAYSGFFAWRGAGGHAPFLAFHYLPWVLYFFRRAHDDVRYCGAVGLLMGLVLAEGGTYPFPLITMAVVFEFVVSLLGRRDWRPIRTAALTGSLTLLVGAIRLWPIYVTMQRFPRSTELEDKQTLADVLESLTGREPHDWHWGHRWVWPEYGSFIGWGALALAGFGVFLAVGGRRRHVPWVLGALLFGAFAMGNVGPEWPWPLLHELPVFDNLHVPSRFHVLLTFYLALVASLSLDWLADRFARTSHRRLRSTAAALAWLLVLGVAAEVGSNSFEVAARWDSMGIGGDEEAGFHYVGGNYIGEYMHYPQRNVGTRACYDPIPWEVSPMLWTGQSPQVRADPQAALTLERFERTNHTFTAQVTLSEPARLRVNQNFDADWHLSVGEPIEDNGLLVFDLPAGSHTVVGRYVPPDLPGSALLTALGILLCLWLLVGLRVLRRRRLRRARASRRAHTPPSS